MIGSNYLGNNTTSFTVWAPQKDTMLLHLVHPQDRIIEMQKDIEGYFTATVEDAVAGSQYFYMPNGEKDTPDVASNFQSQDVYGASEVVDHGAYKWNDLQWKGLPFKELVFTEIHVGTFTEEGTFEAMIPYLDHLAETGINAIELMPVNQFSGSRNWGYDATYPYAVHLSYGGPEGLKKLVDACHQKGIAVFLDLVYNHVGPEGNYFNDYGPYFSDRYNMPWGHAFNFDGDYSDGVREYFANNPVYWMEHYHIDGLRLDAVHEIYDRGAVSFWQLMNDKVKQAEQRLGRRLYLSAESDYNSSRVTKLPAHGGMGFDAQWLDDFHHILYIMLDYAGRNRYADYNNMSQLAKAFTDGFVHTGEWVEFRKRRHGASSAGVPGDQFVVFNTNHDQVGNRIKGERLSVLVNFEQQKLAAAVMLLSPYVPMFFMGEEYGEDAPFHFFVSHHEQQNIDSVRTGRRKEFEKFGLKEGENFPDPGDINVFNRCKLQWHKRTEGKYKIMLEWNKTLLQMRRENMLLQSFDKSLVKAYPLQEDGIIVTRQSSDGRNLFISCINFSDKEIAYTLPYSSGGWNKLIDSKEQQWMFDAEAQPQDTKAASEQPLQLQPYSVVVYSNE